MIRYGSCDCMESMTRIKIRLCLSKEGAAPNLKKLAVFSKEFKIRT